VAYLFQSAVLFSSAIVSIIVRFPSVDAASVGGPIQLQGNAGREVIVNDWWMQPSQRAAMFVSQSRSFLPGYFRPAHCHVEAGRGPGFSSFPPTPSASPASLNARTR
jgi:hypothetical protein